MKRLVENLAIVGMTATASLLGAYAMDKAIDHLEHEPILGQALESFTKAEFPESVSNCYDALPAEPSEFNIKAELPDSCQKFGGLLVKFPGETTDREAFKKSAAEAYDRYSENHPDVFKIIWPEIAGAGAVTGLVVAIRRKPRPNNKQLSTSYS